MAGKIAAHRAERPSDWRTIEEPVDVTGALEREAPGDRTFVVLDSVTLWVSNLMGEGAGERDLLDRVERLLGWRAAAACELCAVSDEVGLALVPDSPVGRAYRDLLGRTNQALAAAADRTLVVIAGMAIDLAQAGARPVASFGALPEPAGV
jgi:adenosyl cobinamide kinase/adenosyl cobinamide phosphate guanylyltransferase